MWTRRDKYLRRDSVKSIGAVLFRVGEISGITPYMLRYRQIKIDFACIHRPHHVNSHFVDHFSFQHASDQHFSETIIIWECQQVFKYGYDMMHYATSN